MKPPDAFKRLHCLNKASHMQLEKLLNYWTHTH